MKTLLHLDMDSYFASVEQQFNQKLTGRPVGIIKALGRTCVIAASREAKRFGVKTGTNIWEAKTLCPSIVFVPADFDKYFYVTKKFLKICEKFSPYIEVFSIDELFMDVTESQKFFGGKMETCLKIKEVMKKEIGQYITCSIGLSYNRLLAKLASGMKKPDGIFEITQENKDEVLFSCQLTDVCGLGYRLQKRLHQMGIRNFKTLREIPLEFLKASFGPYWSLHLKRLSYGEDDSLLSGFESLEEAKSISRTFTLFENTCDLRKIRQTIRNLCEEVGFKLRKMEMMTRQVGLGVRGENQGGYLHRTFQYYTDDSAEIFRIAWELFNQTRWSGSVRFLGVWAGLLKREENLTLSLFPQERKRERIWEAVDRINEKFGGFTIYPAVLMGSELIRPEVNGFLGDKKYQLEFS